MWRRIYCSFPAAHHARRVVAELEAAGIGREQIHTIARSGVDITGLPLANEAQRNDRTWLWEQMFWYGNLVFFGVSLAGVVLAFYSGSILLGIIAVVLAATSFIVGRRFAVQVPHTHLTQMRVPLVHGEVVLLVDVPRERVHEIEQWMSRQHPEAGIGGVGWTIASAGI